MQQEKPKIAEKAPLIQKPDDKKVMVSRSPAAGESEKGGFLDSEEDRVVEAQRMSRFNASTVFTVVVIMAMMLVAFPTFIVFAIGMLPTFVGNLTQIERNSYRYIALASLNFAGVMPYILDLWLEGHKIEIALRIVTDVYALFVMYGAAALAVSVFWAAPQIAASYLSVINARRLNALHKVQESLINEWGADVDISVTPASE